MGTYLNASRNGIKKTVSDFKKPPYKPIIRNCPLIDNKIHRRGLPLMGAIRKERHRYCLEGSQQVYDFLSIPDTTNQPYPPSGDFSIVAFEIFATEFRSEFRG